MATSRGIDPFAETEDRQALRDLARDVGRRAVAPGARDADLSGELSEEALEALAAADLFRVTIGEEWGGLGLGDVEAAIVLEEIARHDVSTAICCQLAFNGPSRGIEHLGGAALKDRWLPQVADGRAIVEHRHHRARRRLRRPGHAQRPGGRRAGPLAAQRLQELLDPRSPGGGDPGVVPVARR